MIKNTLDIKKVTDQVIQYIEECNDLNELEQKIGEELTPVILTAINKQLTSKQKNLAMTKRFYNSKNDIELSIETQIELNKLKEITKKFREMKKDKPSKQTRLSKSIQTTNRLDSKKEKLITEINDINYWLNDAILDEFRAYQENQMISERIRILKELQLIYKKATQELQRYKKEKIKQIKHMVAIDSHTKENFDTTEKILYDKLNTKEYKILQESIKELVIECKKSSHVLTDLNRLIELEHIIMKQMTLPELTNEDLIESKDFLEPKNDIEQKLQIILRKLLQGKYLKQYGDKLLTTIPPEITDLIESLKSLSKEELENLTYLAEGVIKNARKKIKKGDSNQTDIEKIFLQKVEKQFKNIRPVSYENDEDTSVYYDILHKLMADDRNYQYIKELIEIEQFKNARKKSKQKFGKSRKKVIQTEKEHIILLLLDEFIKNYKLKLLDQGLEFKDPIFYKNVIKLFISKNTELTEVELAKYINRLDEFKMYVKSKGYQNTSRVLNDIDEINYFQQQNKQVEQKEQAEILSKTDKKEIVEFSLKQGMAINNKKAYPNYFPSLTTKTFILEDIKPFAFSLSYLENGSTKIGIHILDTTKIINYNDLLKLEFEKGLLSFPQFQEKSNYPTISFEYLLKNNYQIQKKSITPSNLHIDKCFSKQDLDEYQKIPELKQFLTYVNVIQENLNSGENFYQENTIQELITKHISETISYSFQNNSIPFIYQSYLPENDRLIQQNHNETVADLIKVSKKMAHQIYDILDKKVSGYYIPEKTENSSIELNPDTEAGIYLLNVIHKVYNQNYNPEEEQEEVRNLLLKLNSDKEYVPSGLLEGNDKKIKQMIHTFNKRKTKS